MTLQQQDLLNWTPSDYDASGKTYDPKKDRIRLSRQCRAVWAVVRDGRWYTLEALKHFTGVPEASCSARIRDLKNIHGCVYEKKRAPESDGLWLYRFDPQSQPDAEKEGNG